MSLEARIELLTAAVIELTVAIGGMQALASTEGTTILQLPPSVEEPPNVQAQTVTTSGEQSAPTGESSSPALDYDEDVKTITLALSKAKGPKVTKAILEKFDVASAKQLVAGQWGDYIAACNKALA